MVRTSVLEGVDPVPPAAALSVRFVLCFRGPVDHLERPVTPRSSLWRTMGRVVRVLRTSGWSGVCRRLLMAEGKVDGKDGWRRDS